jgi:predicted DCC family thiol-disulfide oxidoreductase YuxK
MGAYRAVSGHPIVLFDGVCNLCNASVLFIIRRDAKAKFRFAPLQSDLGKEVIEQFNLPSGEPQSVLLLKNGKLFKQSDAALEIARLMDGGWPLLYGFKIIPSFLRDGMYAWIARNRYRWFGKKDECMIPTPDLKARFLVA